MPDTTVHPLGSALGLWAPLPWMLEAAIVLEIVLGHYIEGAIIAGLVVFNAGLGLFQEGRAQATLAALKSRLALNASARRDAKWATLPAADLVPGDVIKLSLGGVVAVDVRLTEGEVLLDQSMLTGQSVPVGAVTATGPRTKFGRTAELVLTAQMVSSQQKAVLRVARNLTAFSGVVIVVILAYAFFLKLPCGEIIPLILTAIPAALPATFTIASAIGAPSLAKIGVLQTRLSAVDEAATLDVLCADKTGTLIPADRVQDTPRHVWLSEHGLSSLNRRAPQRAAGHSQGTRRMSAAMTSPATTSEAAPAAAGSRLIAAIFDVDGVLLASPHERAWREALAGYADPARFTTAVYQAQVAGKPRMAGALAALEAMGVPDAERQASTYAARKQARLEELIHAGSVTAFPDALRFVQAVKNLGWPMAVASSSKNANAMLKPIRLPDASSLHDAFSVNVCGRDLRHGKPDPEIFLLAAAELHIAPARCFVAEDAPAGIKAARAGGMAGLGVARLQDAAGLEAQRATLVVTSLDQVAVDGLSEGVLRGRPV